jgi:hypothetical protein
MHRNRSSAILLGDIIYLSPYELVMVYEYNYAKKMDFPRKFYKKKNKVKCIHLSSPPVRYHSLLYA